MLYPRNEEGGRAYISGVLARIADTPGHPMATVAQVLRLGDLLFLRQPQEAVIIGEQLADEANAVRMKGLLIQLGDVGTLSGTLAPEIEAVAYVDFFRKRLQNRGTRRSQYV